MHRAVFLIISATHLVLIFSDQKKNLLSHSSNGHPIDTA